MKKYSDINITWCGDITSYSGWAQHARGVLEPLINGGANVRLEMVQPGRPETKLPKWWEETFGNLSKASPGNLAICHGGIDMFRSKPTNLPLVISTHWETQEIPSSIVGLFNESNAIGLIVPNDELRKSAERKINKPVFTVNFPINKLQPSSNQLELSGIKDNTIVFGIVGEWNNRHNISDAVISYLRAFTSRDNVALVLKTFVHNPSSVDERQKMLNLLRQIKNDAKKPNTPNIIVIQDILSYNSMDALLSRINIYISTSRGASKDISCMRVAAAGKQCIVPDHTAYKILASARYNQIYNIRHIYEPVILTPGLYNINDSWAKIDTVQLSDLMNRAYNDLLLNASMLKEDSAKLSENLLSTYSPDNCTDQLASAIRKVVNPIPVIDFAQ